jgi:hypothetical protein
MIHIAMMRRIIKAHGHLVLTGEETKADLTEALLNLRKHTYMECHKPYLGEPIEALMPDMAMLAPAKRHRVKRVNIDMTKELL